MKSLIFSALLALSFNSFASSQYECEFTGPNYLLTLNDNNTVTLENRFKRFECLKGFENFPGTSLELRILECKSGSDKATFYFTEYSDTEIILSRNIVLSKDISCNKL